MEDTLTLVLPMAMVTAYAATRLYSRLQLSRSKHASLRGHAKWSRRLARLVPYYEFNQAHFYRSDGAPEDIAAIRERGMRKLAREIRENSPKAIAYNREIADSISDVGFTSQYRVPFQYREQLPEEFKLSNVATQTDGVRIMDLDGNWRYDCAGSYGVNVFGYDFYKECIDEGVALAQDLGPVLGPYHPLIRDVVNRLREISQLDEVSFHMSGTEAVMQAVRLARYHTGRSHLVRFCGAYHGWWDGVQPGVGNQRRINDVYTLSDMSKQTLKVLGTRKDIACVLVNPLQGLHPNSDAPGDATLLNERNNAMFDREAYTQWLQDLRKVCTDNNIVLIFDEVFTGFRLGQRGAMEYFGVQADMVTYGKSLGGGLPVGVLCGRAQLMKRFRPEQPVNVSFARGTFNSHPYVLTSMYIFLQRMQSRECQQVYTHADQVWNDRVAELNARLDEARLPVRIANLQSVLTVLYIQPGRYNWVFQFYLRHHGLELSWTGSGRLIMSLAYSDEEFSEVMERFVAAALHMHDDAWWWQSKNMSRKSIARQIAREFLGAKLRGTRGRQPQQDNATDQALARVE